MKTGGPSEIQLLQKQITEFAQQIYSQLIYLGECAEERAGLLRTINSTLEQINYELEQIQKKLGR